MKKSLILFLYVVAIFFILRNYYAQKDSSGTPVNTGMPNPQVLTAPTYLYAILALTADFLEGFPIVLALALTVSLIWQATGNQPKSVEKKVK